MLLLDAGTTYSKTYCTITGKFEVFPTSRLAAGASVAGYDVGCGHFAGRSSRCRVNELVALALGSLRLVEDDDFCVVDVGSRDIKYVSVKARKYSGSDWNQSCGAFTGFTIEMLGRHLNLDYNGITPSDKPLSVTCGVFGMAEIFDMIANGIPPEEAASSLVKGIAMSVYRFAQQPERLYLSGGLCENRLFTGSFPCEVINLGRFVTIEGLKEYAMEKNRI